MACGSCAASRNSKTTYKWTGADGTTKVFSTEVEAKAAVARKGGSYKAQ
jgi:hypothetical protein